MELELRKLTFITLAQSLFQNRLKGINKDNCIRFYHYLMDGLESKSQILLQEDDDEFLVCDAIVNTLELFPEMDQQQLADLIKYENYIVEYLREKTLMSEQEVKKALQSVRGDAILRMSLFLNTP
jgi:hypothetical protein